MKESPFGEENMEQRFSKNALGIICDLKTSLEWLVGPDKDTDWYQAKAWVEKIDSSRYGTGWRMPTRKELRQLYEESKGEYNIDPVFEVHPVWKGYKWLWAWTVEEMDSSSAWGFSFNYGDVYWGARSLSDYSRVFAVRKARLPTLAFFIFYFF